MYKALINEIEAAQNIALCGHIIPDGDCLGAMLALGMGLKQLGKNISFYSAAPLPETYVFLPGVKEIQTALEPQKRFDLLIIVDCSTPDRIVFGQELLNRSDRVAIVDHHAGSKKISDLYINLPNYAAVGEIIYDFLLQLPVCIDDAIATCLYVAIATDTGSFSYSNTSSNTHLRIAELMKKGAPAAHINKLLYEERPLANLLVLRASLQTLQISECGRIASMYIKKETMHSLNASAEHAEGMINFLRSIKGVELALFFRELEDCKYKVSFRSKHYLDVNKLAALFGGGGHKRASGCFMQGDLEYIKGQLLQAASASFALSEAGSLD